ncbi:sister chromatid cohesion 1 protein 2-like [Dorcoceras hygrometricum]|uniref:Sister chromatid cohesion 1 protein 2-like n=1 Tax=Dorcoceras hygrometricum TaxID=472368 RepID=A0A2Z7A8Y5_9LAMI|nr:sister chromatid cohesion 1 protein 2-like [Dorcoceras hygrometricum]
MFYSRLLLSKKGSLGFVWIAAHCPKRLKKDQVRKTDISSSVDKILADEVPIVTHRILAYLLLGVVRIYSMKVEYLFHDCNDALNKLCEFNVGKRTRPDIGVSRTNYPVISVPKNFELDEFDLEILENQDIAGGNMVACEDVVLADKQMEMDDALSLLDKEIGIYNISSQIIKLYCSVLLPPHMEYDNNLLMNSSCENGDFVTSIEKLCGTTFLLEDWPSPTVLKGSEKEQKPHRLPSESPRINYQWLSPEMICDSFASPSGGRSDVVPSILQENSFSLEDRLDPLVLDEAEERQIQFRSNNEDLRTNSPEPIQYLECAMIPRPSHKKRGIEEEHVEPPRIELNLHEDEPCALIRSTDIGQPVDVKKKKIVEVITPEIRKCRRNQEHLKPMTVDVSPNSRRPEAGVGTPEVATVRTPAPKERVKILKKRKILLDPTTVLPSKVLKSWIDYPNDIIYKRRKVPHTLLQAWRANKVSRIPQCFLDPLIHNVQYSARTRAVGIFLYKNFLCKKRPNEEDEVLNLTHLLRGKVKKNSARLFYEILDKAYDDIMLQEVPKLKQIAATNVV